MKRLEICGLLFLVGCGDSGAATGELDASGGFCTGDSDCGVDQRCESQVCVFVKPLTKQDGASGGEPEIVLSPTELDFGAPQWGEEVELRVEIANIGSADLHIARVGLVEDDANREYLLNSEIPRNLAIEPGSAVALSVSLRTNDTAVDTGTLSIYSDDADEPKSDVRLVSELKGTPTLCFCALHEPGLDPLVTENCGDAEEVDFSGTPFGTTVSKDVAIWNCAEAVEGDSANVALAVASADTTDETDYADLFTAWAYSRDDAGIADSLTFPVDLAPVDSSSAPGLRILYVRVTYSAEDDGGTVPEEFLRFVSNNGGLKNSVDDFPLVGASEGCPEGFFDNNRNPEDGCESACLPTGAEICDGFDNDCDGSTDEGIPAGSSCDGDDGDLCSEGLLVCVAGLTVCNDTTPTNEEFCDELDNDCDGYVDEDFFVGTRCDGLDGDLCMEGMTICSLGIAVCDDTTATRSETCNAIDDDCDGDIDEGIPAGATCDGYDGDLCREGVLVCAGGEMVCNDVTPTNEETCNGLDDNCNGSIDEAIPLGAACDGPDGDFCAEGALTCVDGEMTCGEGLETNAEACNGIDDDCDGTLDDGATCGALPGATGAACQSGECLPTGCRPGYVDCDGIGENGCEIDRDDDTACPSFSIGSVSGDLGGEVITDAWNSEEWDYFELREDSDWPIYVSATVQLDVPPGLDFDLCCSCYGCAGSVANCSFAGEGETDLVTIRREDYWGNDDTASYFCHVIYYSGNVCGNWGLTVTGNTVVEETTCF